MYYKNSLLPAVVDDWSETHWLDGSEDKAKSIPLDVLVRISKELF